VAKKKTDGRDSNHDELVSVLLNRRLDVLRACGMANFGRDGRRLASIEWPIGKGFVDFAVRWERTVVVGRSSSEDTKRQATAIFVEVKSEREHWSAGDVIRQQKNHRKSFAAQWPATQWNQRSLWTDDFKRYTWPVLAFFCPRELTAQEAALFRHERFVVLPHEWAAPALSLVGI
jgi:hypothetical protein